MEYISLHGYIRNTPQTQKCRQNISCDGQEYLTSGKEYTDPWKARDQALSLWSGSTDSKTLD